ncbi:MAG: O-acetyl-L-homoserine sulfhydrylase [Desulfovibrio sp.]
MLIDGGTFDWKDYPGLTEPDESYHGVVYTETFGRQAYITKARTQLMRDIGASPTAHAAFLLNLGLETLALRMERHSANAQETAEFLAAQADVEYVNYPGLKGDKYYDLGQKYLPDGASGVISFSLKGGRDAAVKFMDSLELASNVVHVATVKTCVLHPASETHRQLSDEQLVDAGITPGMIRLSVGIEDIGDIIQDLEKGFAAIR